MLTLTYIFKVDRYNTFVAGRIAIIFYESLVKIGRLQAEIYWNFTTINSRLRDPFPQQFKKRKMKYREAKQNG